MTSDSSKIRFYVESEDYHTLKHPHFYPVTYPYLYCYVVDAKFNATPSIAILTNKHIEKDVFIDAVIVGAVCIKGCETVICVFNNDSIHDVSDLPADVKKCLHWVLSNSNKSSVLDDFRDKHYGVELYGKYSL
jgi:hypothetical protein